MTRASQRVFAPACLAALIALSACSEKQPVQAEEKPHAAPVMAAISPGEAQAAGIAVAIAGPGDIKQTIALFGTVKSNAEKEQNFRARYPGTVRAVQKSIGDAVVRGATLLTIESSSSLQPYSISSSINGTVLDRNANVGDTVGGETILMRVADLSTVWVEFAVFARDLGNIREGMPVRVTATDGRFLAQVRLDYVAPALHAENQSVVARATVDNARMTWVPGQFVSGDVVVSEFQAPVTIQPSALQTLKGKPVVFVQDARGFKPRPVRLGRRSETAVEITGGLSAGERYATTNSYLVKAELLKGEAGDD